ncbi:LysM peptidoglycan-binding domain-containing protein [Ignavigranum ruoffiae]|uniref:LysM peptidoglycan-binding domain-containing protein n=1 Tax=Ignavigranum ruoffiae TaxID=89093 RepID=UPI003AFFAB25
MTPSYKQMILPLIATASLSLAQTVAAEETYHTVQAGETLYSISKRYDISVENLKNWNQLQSNNLNVNQVLLVAQDTEQVDSSTDQEENLTTTEEESPSLEISSENTPESVSNPNSQNTYTVKAGESVYIIAYKFNITADQLKAANGLKSDLIHPNQVLIIPSANHEKPAEPKPTPQPDKNTYTVKAGESLYIIANKFGVTVKELKAANGLKSDLIHPNQVLIIPSANNEKPEDPKPTPQPDKNTYTVKAGESLYIIANKFGVTVKELKAANGLKSDLIHPNQVLIIPSANNEKPEDPKPTPQPDKNTYTVKAGESLYIIANKFGVTVKELKAANGLKSDLIHPNQVLIIPSANNEKPEEPKPTPQPDKNTYTVKAGESLYIIANKFGVTVKELKAANGLKSDLIHPNQVLIIPTSQDQDTDKEKPKTQIEKNVYRTLDLAIKAAKDHFNYKIHSQWYVDWTANGYKVRYDYK